MGGRIILVGDVHGCLEEMDELMSLVQPRSQDTVMFLGDIIDRGPDPVGCVRRLRERGWQSVLGNHDEKALRWRRHEHARKTTGRKNPVFAPGGTRLKHWEDRLEEWRSLSEDDLTWIASLPVFADLRNGWFASHAGFEPGVPMFFQRPEVVIRIRYVDLVTKSMTGPREDTVEQPEGTEYWTRAWKGPQSVVYGHAVHSLKSPRTDHGPPAGFTCVGIDTGCVFGGMMTAMIMDGDAWKFVQVASRAAYRRMPGLMAGFQP